jgi:hypothetical protein
VDLLLDSILDSDFFDLEVDPRWLPLETLPRLTLEGDLFVILVPLALEGRGSLGIDFPQ